MRTACITLLCCLVCTAVRAQEPKPAAPPAPYSIPWQLRPAPIVDVLRIETVLASYRTTGDGLTTVPMFLAAKKLRPDFSLLARWGFVHDAPPNLRAETGVINPVVAGVFGRLLRPDLRYNVFLGFAIPLGAGGGDNADPAVASAVRSGVFARSAMDNAMFAVNDFTIIPGATLAWTRAGFTVQLEATVLQLIRVKGGTQVTGTGAPAPANPDAAKTNFTTGLHVGYFVQPWVSLGGDLRMQRWLSTPRSVQADPTLRDTFSFAVGPRFHFKVGRTWFRPGIAYAQGIDAPMTARRYRIVQFDIPVLF